MPTLKLSGLGPTWTENSMSHAFAHTIRTALDAHKHTQGLVDDTGGGGGGSAPRDISFLGSMLFTRCVSGTRVVVPSTFTADAGSAKDPTAKSIGPLTFPGYGSHADAYGPGPYLTAACAIGVTKEEVDEFLRRLDKALGDFSRRRRGRKDEKPK